MEKKIFGVIESIDDRKKEAVFLGYGIYDGHHPKELEDLGIEAETPRIKLDNGVLVWGDSVIFFGEKDRIDSLLEDLKSRGYTIR